MLCPWYIAKSPFKTHRDTPLTSLPHKKTQADLFSFWVTRDAAWINSCIKIYHSLIKFPALRININMFRSKRKDSAIRTLVAETLVLAKTHGYVEKIEYELEEELIRENLEPPNRILAKWRRNGENLLKNKYTLLTVALFCVTECALILGELILDLHKVKVVLEAQELDSKTFVEQLHRIYPDRVYPDDNIKNIYTYILQSTISWSHDIYGPGNILDQNGTGLRHKRSPFPVDDVTASSSKKTDIDSKIVNSTTNRTSVNSSNGHHGSTYGHSLEQSIAHAFHMASITILSILVFETILKALCAGTAFFQRKLETFDLCIVMISFVVDLVCMQIMPRYKIQDFVFILAFLLPWRVIRVVNSLVVAVQDHEHFRLKLIYGRKKKIVNSLRESEIKLQLFRAQCNALKRLCFNEGVDEAKIDQILMVEECVVNKAGKSKCKIKIDNSSVILLNDKSDFPRLSPRPSLLSLVDKVGRRKSMQPPGLPTNEKELYLNTKESSKRGILKSRARSNSESGRGTLSSPEDAPGAHSSFGEGWAYSGLSTPIVVNRKNSLNSPLMACHVRNILNSLEDKVNQMNGSCSRMGGGRGSIDTDSIAEEIGGERESGCRVDSIEEDAEAVDCCSNEVSYVSKRRASLQPQKCVDEDDCDLIAQRKENMEANRVATIDANDVNGFGSSKVHHVNAPVVNSNALSPPRSSHRFIPTTIQIDPPSTQSNYSTSSSSSSPISNIIGNVYNFSISQSLDGDNKTSSWNYGLPEINDTQANISPTPTRSETVIQIVDESPTLIIDQSHVKVIGQSSTVVKVPGTFQVQYATPEIPYSLSMTLSESSQETPKSIKSESFVLNTEALLEPKTSDITSKVSTNLKPKTLRTPSDIENQNNLTFSESTDMGDPQSLDLNVRGSSVDRLPSDFVKFDDMLPKQVTYEQAIPTAQHLSTHENEYGQNKIDNIRISSTSKPVIANIEFVENFSKSVQISKDDIKYSSPSGSSVDPPLCGVMLLSASYLQTKLETV